MKEVVHFGNTTNNRVENANRQLKKLLKRRDSLPCVLKKLYAHVMRTFSEKAGEDAVSMRKRKYYCVDDTTQNLVDSFTPFAAELVIQNILRRGEITISHTADDLIFIHDNQREFTVSSSQITCTCSFNMGYRLPCRHLLYVKKVHGLRDGNFNFFKM